MRALLVVNPKATTTSARARDVLAHALASEVKLDVVETEARGHATALAKQAALDGLDAVVARVGEGNGNEGVNGVPQGAPPDGLPGPGAVQPAEEAFGAAGAFDGGARPRLPVPTGTKIYRATSQGSSRTSTTSGP